MVISRTLAVLAVSLLGITAFFAWGKSRGKTYVNPVLVETYTIQRPNPAYYRGTLGIGDPSVIRHEGLYYLYPTGDNRGYDVYISKDLVAWRKGPRVFQSKERGAWAPDVFHNPADGRFYLYYTVNTRIGVAVADRPDGTFEDQGTLIDDAIDAHMFLDSDGKFYLYYTEYPALRILVQPMRSPVAAQGRAVALLHATEPWEKKLIPMTEAPWILKFGGLYYLLYSASAADSVEYAVGYATAESPLGPFTKFPGNPIMRQGNGVFGPGHCSITTDASGNLWMVYHQQKGRSRGWNRIICIDPVSFSEDGIIRVRATRSAPRVAPAVR